MRGLVQNRCSCFWMFWGFLLVPIFCREDAGMGGCDFLSDPTNEPRGFRVNDPKSSASSRWVDHRGICRRDPETCRTIPRRQTVFPVHFLEGLGNWDVKS